MPYCLTSSGVIAPISGWVICPTFSAVVMPARIFATRLSSAGFCLIRLLTLGQSASVGSFFSMRAQPSESRAGPSIDRLPDAFTRPGVRTRNPGAPGQKGEARQQREPAPAST